LADSNKSTGTPQRQKKPDMVPDHTATPKRGAPEGAAEESAAAQPSDDRLKSETGPARGRK